jgi:D-aminoacyl-tRNA deacylase
VQRVLEASVGVVAPDGSIEEVGGIGPGLCVLVGVTHDDTATEATKLAERLWGLRIFDGLDGGPERSVADVSGALLVVSQFTLYGETTRGRRPSWSAAARPEHAAPLVDAVVARLRELGATVATGVFRAHMQVALVNDGPFTVIVEVEAVGGGNASPS